ncbi:hypothetical protein AAVH_22928 [Aphelenchoides avenae]|nr:hypothetical protein AAVH_22928 [Aphelenchus avenae]
MSSTLSPSAVYQIIFYALPTGKKKKYSKSNRLALQTRMNKMWKAVHKLYLNSEPAQPVGYLDSLELALALEGQVNDADVQAIFAHGKPLEFYGCPRQLVSKIVEAFSALQTEPAYLDVTINDTYGYGPTRPSEALSQVYKTHLPCYACTQLRLSSYGAIPT